jgi:hypothetical protein
MGAFKRLPSENLLRPSGSTSARRARNLALFNHAIDSKLRGCDLAGLRDHDVGQGSQVAARAIVMQKKAQRPVQFEMTEQNTRRRRSVVEHGTFKEVAIPLS